MCKQRTALAAWFVVVVVVVFALVTCGKGDKKPEKEAPAAAQPTSEPAKPSAPPADKAPAALTRAEVDRLIEKWLAAQNRGKHDAYAALYAAEFEGVRRSGKAEKKLDRDGWLKDRERMFEREVAVNADEVKAEIRGLRAKVEFIQTWESGAYKDQGRKKLEIAKQADVVLIAREEMLDSKVMVTWAAAERAMRRKHGARKGVYAVHGCEPFDDAGERNLCVFTEHDPDEAGESDAFIAALIGKKGGKWRVLDEEQVGLEAPTLILAEMNEESPGLQATASIAGPVALTASETVLRAEFAATHKNESEDRTVGEETTLSRRILYRDRDGEFLKALVLDNKKMSEWAPEGHDNEQESVQTYRILPTKTKGFYDIEVESKERSKDLMETSDWEKETRIMRWNGEEYLAE